jgi:hypothetical protein
VGLVVLCFILVACSRAAPGRSAQHATSFRLYFVALNPSHPAGEPIGCGDVLVSEGRTASGSGDGTSALDVALREQLTAKPPAGGVNRLADLGVRLRSVRISGDHAKVVLEPFSLGGECDNPRVEAQLTHVAGQFDAFRHVNIYVGDQPLADYLSLR